MDQEEGRATIDLAGTPDQRTPRDECNTSKAPPENDKVFIRETAQGNVCDRVKLPLSGS